MKRIFSGGVKKEAAAGVNQVRGLLLLRHMTLTGWAAAHGYRPGTVHNALSGRRLGPRSRRIAVELRSELGV